MKDLAAALERLDIRLPLEDENMTLILSSFIKLWDLPGAWNFLPGRIRQVEEAIEIEVFGENAKKAAKRAEQKCDLFKYLFGIKLN